MFIGFIDGATYAACSNQILYRIIIFDSVLTCKMLHQLNFSLILLEDTHALVMTFKNQLMSPVTVKLKLFMMT